MLRRKNALFFVLILNCMYFLGISFLVNRQLSTQIDHKEGLSSWIHRAAEVVLKNLILEQTYIPNLMAELDSKKNLPLQMKVAQNYGVSSLIELTDESHIAIIGKRNDIPFESNHFKANTIGFHKKEEHFVFSYFWRSTDPLRQRKFLIVKEKPIQPVLEQLDLFGIDLTVTENDTNEQRILYSSLQNEVSRDFLNQTLQPLKNDLQMVTLNKEKYLVKIFSLSQDPQLIQTMIFSLKLPNYEAISLTEMLIYLWTSFCISVVFLFFVFKKFELSDKPQEHP